MTVRQSSGQGLGPRLPRAGPASGLKLGMIVPYLSGFAGCFFGIHWLGGCGSCLPYLIKVLVIGIVVVVGLSLYLQVAFPICILQE